VLETRPEALAIVSDHYLSAIFHANALPVFILGKLGSDLSRWLTATHSSRESTLSGQGAGWSGWKVSHCSSCLCRIWLVNKGLVFQSGFQLNFGKHRHLLKHLKQFIW